MLPMSSFRGNQLTALPVTPTKAQGVTTLNQIESYGLPEPLRVKNARKADVDLNPRLLQARAIHSNREFTADRVRRAEIYAKYIENVTRGVQPGGVPAITLWCPNTLEFVPSTQTMLVPYDQLFCAIDGQTQTQARFFLRAQHPETGNWPFAVTVYHGTTLETANQILHDYNRYASPVTVKEAAAFNHVGTLSKAAAEALTRALVRAEQVNSRSAVPALRKEHLVSRQQVLTFLAAYLLPEKAEASRMRGYFDRLNDVNSQLPVPEQAIRAAVGAIAACVVENSEARFAGVDVWQAVGAFCAKANTVPDNQTFTVAAHAIQRAGKGAFSNTMGLALAALAAQCSTAGLAA